MNTIKDKILNHPVAYQGYWYSEPKISSLDFTNPEKVIVNLEDGRTIITSLEKFPSIKDLSLSERQDYGIFNDGKAVDIYACDEMYHIRDFMGIPENWMK